MEDQQPGKFLKYAARGVFAVYLVCLALATHWPMSKLPRHLPPDEILHFAAYALLGFLCTVVVAEWFGGLWIGRFGICCLVTVVLSVCALLDESTQPMAGRSFEWGEWIVDVAGIMTASVLVTGFSLIRQWRKPCHPVAAVCSIKNVKSSAGRADSGS